MLQSQFIQPTGSYLLNHSVGLMPLNTQTYIEDHFLAPWASTPQQVWDAWLHKINDFRRILSELLGGRVGSYCPQTNLSSGLTKLLHALPQRQAETNVLLTEAAFPSLGYVFEKADAKCCFIGHQHDVQDLELWAQTLRNNVDIVLITHVHSNTGERLPVQDIIELARAAGVVSVVDIAQSAGVVPINIEAWNADFVIGSCVKWLCGGPGAGFLWVNPNILGQCQPVDVGWFSHEAPFEFDIHQFRYAEDALRFWGGTPSVVPYVVATNAISMLNKFGIENIQQHNQTLSQLWLNALDERWFDGLFTPKVRGGTTVLNVGDSCEEFSNTLNSAQIHHDIRNQSIRLSPHIYNTEEDIKKVIDCLMPA